MPIKAFIGRPRQGKSYSVVKNVILPALRKGRTVVTDIPLKDKAYNEFPDQIIFQKEIDYANIVAGAVYVIDEFWKDCEMGTSPKNVSKDIRHFIAMHGHSANEKGITTEIVIITQNLDQVCTYVTGLVETTYYVEKINITDKIKKCRTQEFNGSVKGNPPRAKPVGSKTDNYESEIFEYYKSHTGVESDENIIEMDAIKAKKLTDFKFVKYFIPVLLIFFFYILPKGLDSFKSLTNPENIQDQTTEEIKNPKTKKTPSTKAKQSNVAETKEYDFEPVDHSEKEEKIYKDYDFFDELNVFPLSKDKRITGIYKIITEGVNWFGVHITIKNEKTINLPMQNVRIDALGQYFVVYRNEIITELTGKPLPQPDYSHLPDGSYVVVEKIENDNNIVRGLRGQSE